MSLRDGSIKVEIYGRVYSLRSNDDEAYVQSLAGMIHDKMVSVEKVTQTVDTTRIAILAALNLADDYCKLRKEYDRRVAELETEQARLLELVEGALSGNTKKDPA